MRPVLATILLTTGLHVQAAEIYCNAQGRECSDRPTPSANIARSLGPVSASARSSATAGASTASSGSAAAATVQDTDPNAPPDAGIRPDPVAEQQRQNAATAAASKAVQKDLTDKRSEQCRKAQDYYKQAIEAAAIFRTDKDGKRQLLTEAEANQSRLNARMEIERTCGKGGG